MGPSHIDEYLALNGICFLISCICSYSSIRRNDLETKTRNRMEQIADVFFIIGLVVMTFQPPLPMSLANRINSLERLPCVFF
jgi:hypothetical protein